MKYNLFILLLGLVFLGCNELNSPNTDLHHIPYCSNCDGCDFTRDIEYRSNDSIIAIISIHSNSQSFSKMYLSVFLHEFNPYICDVPACAVETRTLMINHNYGDTILCAINFKYSRSDSLYYSIGAELFKDFTLNYDGRIMYSSPYTGLFHTHLDTVNIKLISTSK